MKTFLACMLLLLGLAFIAPGTVTASTASTCTATLVPAVDHQPLFGVCVSAPAEYEIPQCATVPELGMPITATELNVFVDPVWHPPVLTSNLWLTHSNLLPEAKEPLTLETDNKPRRLGKNEPEVITLFPISWFDIY